MPALRALFERLIARFRRKDDGEPASLASVIAHARLTAPRRPAYRLDARGLQRLLEQTYETETAPPAEVQETPRRATGS
ncbi:MAG TPA: hypothetical protein VD929_00485 [Caulobacteraceae bacterium]|nr:hypothetical protein [Caulobacteraceae bacterium]